MLHRFGFADGSVSYANRFLQSKAYRAAEETGELSYSEFATDPCRSLFKRAVSLFQPSLSDNANVNLVQLGERFVTMTETPLPVAVRSRDPRHGRRCLGGPGDVDDRASTPRPGERGDGQLRRQARAAQRVPVLPAGPDSPADGARVLSSTPTSSPPTCTRSG